MLVKKITAFHGPFRFLQCFLILIGMMVCCRSALSADPRSAELDAYEAELNKSIEYFNATHNAGTPLPPEITRMQQDIKRARASMANGTIPSHPSSGSPVNVNVPSVGSVEYTGVPATGSLTQRQRSILSGVRGIGAVLGEFVRDRQATAERENESDQTDSGPASVREDQLALSEKKRSDDERAYIRASLPQDINERYTALVILNGRYPGRYYAELLRETEAEVARLPARPIFSEPLSSFSNNRSFDSYENNSIKPDIRSNNDGEINFDSSSLGKEAKAALIGKLKEIINPSESGQEAEAKKIEALGRKLRDIRFKAMEHLAENGKENSMGFSTMQEKWMEYAEEAAERSMKREGPGKSYFSATEKLKKAWGEFLDGNLKEMRENDFSK